MRAARVLALQRAFATVVLFGGVLTAVMVADYRERSALPTGITNWGAGRRQHLRVRSALVGNPCCSDRGARRSHGRRADLPPPRRIVVCRTLSGRVALAWASVPE